MPRLGSIVPKSLPREFKPSLGVIMHECLHLHIHIPVLSSKYIQMLDLNKGLKLPQTNSRVHHNILQLGSDRKRAIIPNGQFQEGEKSRQKTAVRWIYNENNNIRVLWKWRNKEKKTRWRWWWPWNVTGVKYSFSFPPSHLYTARLYKVKMTKRVTGSILVGIFFRSSITTNMASGFSLWLFEKKQTSFSVFRDLE